MKIKKEEESKGLSLKTLRDLEQKYGVFFVSPRNKKRSINQQFGVHDEDEVYVGDIIAPERWFTIFSLEIALFRLFGREAILEEEKRQQG